MSNKSSNRFQVRNRECMSSCVPSVPSHARACVQGCDRVGCSNEAPNRNLFVLLGSLRNLHTLGHMYKAVAGNVVPPISLTTVTGNLGMPASLKTLTGGPHSHRELFGGCHYRYVNPPYEYLGVFAWPIRVCLLGCHRRRVGHCNCSSEVFGGFYHQPTFRVTCR